MRTTGIRVFQEQAQALNMIADRLAEEFEQAVELMYNTRGRVIVSGMGKSGIIGSKIAATLASTGTSSFFVHPGEPITATSACSPKPIPPSSSPIAAKPKR
jgi:arabinose-5-phosphate isomerase